MKPTGKIILTGITLALAIEALSVCFDLLGMPSDLAFTAGAILPLIVLFALAKVLFKIWG